MYITFQKFAKAIFVNIVVVMFSNKCLLGVDKWVYSSLNG